MKVGIIGTGAWGTALAQVLVDNNHEVLMYGISNEEIDDINKGYNKKYFGDLRIDKRIEVTTNIKEAVVDASYILIAVPSVAVREIAIKLNKIIKNKPIIVNVSKGFDEKTNKRLSEVIKEKIDEKKREGVVTLIGPSYASEVIRRVCTTIGAVSSSKVRAKDVQKLFSNKYFRVYTLTDEIGAEYGAGLKNIIALASGMANGLGLGENTKAALITRGMAEISRYGIAKGGKLKTYLGLTGFGDLVLTCSSANSRNFEAGYKIGKDDGAEDFFKTNKKTVEGIKACQIIYHESKKNNISTPITDAVYKVLFEGLKPSEAIDKLMLRSLKEE